MGFSSFAWTTEGIRVQTSPRLQGVVDRVPCFQARSADELPARPGIVGDEFRHIESAPLAGKPRGARAVRTACFSGPRHARCLGKAEAGGHWGRASNGRPAAIGETAEGV